MKINKNGNKYKVYQISNGTRKTVASFETKQAAQDFIAGTIIHGKNITIEKAFQLFKKKINKDIQSGIIKKHTGVVYLQHVNYHIEPYLHGTFLGGYKYKDFINTYLLRLNLAVSQQTKQPISATTYKNIIQTFRMAIRFFMDQGIEVGELSRVLEYRTKVPANKKKTKEEFYTTSKDVKLLIQQETKLEYKLLYSLALVSGARTNELLAICYEDLQDNAWVINNTLDNDNVFEPGSVKTYAGFRTVDIPESVMQLINSWKAIQLQKKKEGNVTRVFNISKNAVAKHIQSTAKNIGIEWQGGLSPFRKLCSSLVFDSGLLTEKEFRNRFGWEDLKTFQKYYQRQTNKNIARVDSLFETITKGENHVEI